MGLLKEFNIKLWEHIFEFFYPFTDCVPFILILLSGILAIIFTVLRKKIFGKNYVVGILEIPFLLSVTHMVEQLPQIHNRIELALRTTAEIIMQSTEYVKAFQSVSRVQEISNVSISRYLYYLQDNTVLSETNPTELYYHLFKTLGSTRGIFGFFEVHEKSLAVLIILTMFLAIYIFFRTGIRNIKRTGHFVFQILLLISSLFFNNGVMISVVVFFLIEQFLYELSYVDTPHS